MTTETRVTDSVQCKNGPWYTDLSNGGLVSYRIWQQFDGLRWFQRHEWTNVDGTVRMDEWIPGARAWCPSAKTVEEVPQ